MPHAQFRQETAPLPQGSTLLLYTDGLIERRGEALDEGLERLRASAERHAGAELEELLERIVEDLVGKSASDDVAVLALSSRLAQAGTLSLELPADPSVLSSLRRSLGNFLHDRGVAEDDAFPIMVAAGEAAANAIEHAYGPGESTFHVEAWTEDDEICVLVRDTGSWRGPRSSHRGRGIALMEALADRMEIVPGPAGTEVRLALARRSS
jgi:anti-sigma regulatory factor (Ser/Thr protein kinase)